MAPYPEDCGNGGRANGVGGITFILSRIFCDLEIHNIQFSVILLVDDEEATRAIGNLLGGKGRSEWISYPREGDTVLHFYQDTGWNEILSLFKEF